MENLLGWDTSVLFWVHQHLVSGVWTPWMVGLSTVGEVGAIWILFGIGMLCTKKYRQAGLAVFLALGFSLLVGNVFLKHLIMRARPCFDYPWVTMLIQAPGGNDFSFPSGHTFGAFAAAVALFPAVKRIWGYAAIGLASAIGFSRIYLFMHYPSDVFSGALLGLFFGVVSWKAAGVILPILQEKFGRHHSLEAEPVTPDTAGSLK